MMGFAAFIGVFFLVGFGFAEKAPYPFVKDGTSAPADEYFDYIVVGGGTTGIPLATTLSASSTKVLILERGGWPYDNPYVTTQGGFSLLLLDASPTSPAQQFISTDGVFNHRARVLGGGTSINGGFYSRASADFIGQAGWNMQLVKESYEWVESKMVFQPRVLQWQEAVRKGLLEAKVLPERGFTYEHLNGTKVGGTIFDENGNRHSAVDLLEHADPSKITVYLHSTVQNILFQTSPGQKPKAYAVAFKDSAGATHTAFLNKGPRNEIISSAGALGSPQLLMLSGIGPSQRLIDLGIPVIMKQPFVGQDMVDNPMNVIIIPSRREVETSLANAVGITDDGNYIESINGFIDLASIIKAAQHYAAMANLTIPHFTIPPLLQNGNIQASAVVEKFQRPFSKGHIELQSRDPNINPKVTFNYFQDPRDVESCVRGMEMVKRVVESKSVSSFRYPFTSFESYMALLLALPVNLRARHQSSLKSLQQFCMDTVMSFWHYHGGCRVNKVVDSDYKVIGVDGLRVVDGSTFSEESPGTNPQATLLMLGRYMGQKIIRERSYV